MKSLGNGIKVAAFGILVVGAVVTSVDARRPDMPDRSNARGACCLPEGRGCRDFIKITTCTAGGGYPAFTRCAQVNCREY